MLSEAEQREQDLKFIRAEHQDPEIPEAVTANDLPFAARIELKTLEKDNQEFVARHLAMASILIDSDPELAHQHAISASRKGGRIAIVRETLAITAYTIGDYALALRELRTYRRISGKDDQLALMIDAERGLGRPDRALELGRAADRDALPAAQRAMVAIAMSGARLDQGQADLALAELEIKELNPKVAHSYSPALFAAYGEVLAELGRADEAARWQALAERAEAALADAAHDEHETLEVVTETLDGEPFVEHPVDIPVEGHIAPAAEDEVAAEDERHGGDSDGAGPEPEQADGGQAVAEQAETEQREDGAVGEPLPAGRAGLPAELDPDAILEPEVAEILAETAKAQGIADEGPSNDDIDAAIAAADADADAEADSIATAGDAALSSEEPEQEPAHEPAEAVQLGFDLGLDAPKER